MADVAATDVVSRTGQALTGPPSAQTPEQLRALAVQFESLLLGQMLRDMRRSMFEDEDDESGFGAGPLADAVFSELSGALSRAGGLGLSGALMGPLMKEAGVPGVNGLAGVAAALSPLDVAAALPVLDVTDEAASARPEAFAVAMPGRVSSGYGWRRDPLNGGLKFHNGLDLAMPVGQELPAARPGRVEFAGELDGYGLTVLVRHDDRMATRYAHLSEILVSPGDDVAAGQTLGRSGATGRATGPHLHFELLDGAQAVDPAGVWK